MTSMQKLQVRAIMGIHNDPILQDRGIAKTAQWMGWGYAYYQGGFYWSIPVPNQTQKGEPARMKAFPPHAQPPGAKRVSKYRWNPTKPAGLDFYHLEGVGSRIRNFYGVVNIVNGEPAVLTFIAANIPNVISFYSETSMPQDLPSKLKSLGISNVHYYADADETGIRTARKVKRELEGSGIEFTAIDLRMAVERGDDTNDLWIASGFNDIRFMDALRELPHLELEIEPRKPVYGGQAKGVDQELIRVVVEACASRSRTERPIQSKHRLVMCSPLREDRNPSFSIDMKTGVAIDYGTGDLFYPDQLAELLGVSR